MQENDNLVVVNMFIEELARAGVMHACVSPGSRSTPLMMALARHGGIRLWSLLDERSSSFFALGLARATGSPVALVCTSGTATANYYPAVMEAAQSRVPLLLLTADRPPELHGVGANQTVSQEKLYGRFVKLFVEMPVPDDTLELERHARGVAHRIVAAALSRPCGPVHVNWPFREPLVPPRMVSPAMQGKEAPERQEAPDLAGYAVVESPRRFGHVYLPTLAPSSAALEAAAATVREMHQGLIVCGPQDNEQFPEAVTKFAAMLQIPILADPLSQLRAGRHHQSLIIDKYDVLLRDSELAQQLKPDVIFRFGQPPTSKKLGQYLTSQTQAQQILVDDGFGWRDPFFVATDVIYADPSLFCGELSEHLREVPRNSWCDLWVDMNHALTAATDEIWRRHGEGTDSPDVHEVVRNGLFEGRVFAELRDLLPADTTVVAGNSMPVRDLDSFFSKRQEPIRFLANRGVSGIDGVVSTAFGASAAGSGKTVLVIGDVSFYHDLNGLLAAMRHQLDLVIVLIHNDGGGIFSFLPQAAYTETFGYFRTQHGLEFQNVVEMYGGSFHSATTWEDFRQTFRQALGQRGLFVVELRTDGSQNAAAHQAVFDFALGRLHTALAESNYPLNLSTGQRQHE